MFFFLNISKKFSFFLKKKKDIPKKKYYKTYYMTDLKKKMGKSNY